MENGKAPLCVGHPFQAQFGARLFSWITQRKEQVKSRPASLLTGRFAVCRLCRL